jgi:L-methionine (R)-S-oxide reductase
MLSPAKSPQSLQEDLVGIMTRRLPHFSWTGFYMLDPSDSEVLALGPYIGNPTPYVRIPVT